MSDNYFKGAQFIKTAMLPKDYPVLRDESGNIVTEIAVAGRSNVGKSSLLNHLFHAKNLVKTSSTPGKTQAINFFRVGDKLCFVDLPGYGYAKVSIEVKKNWGPMIQTYLKERKSLKLILFLFDIRRMPTQEDIQFLNWVAENDKSMILVLTKIDKVTRNEKNINTQKIIQAFNTGNLHHVHYSVPKNVGHKELSGMIEDALSCEEKGDEDEEGNE